MKTAVKTRPRKVDSDDASDYDPSATEVIIETNPSIWMWKVVMQMTR
jgi:hypothetical protein